MSRHDVPTDFYILLTWQALIALCVVLYGGWFWVRGTSTPSTEDFCQVLTWAYRGMFVAALVALVLS